MSPYDHCAENSPSSAHPSLSPRPCEFEFTFADGGGPAFVVWLRDQGIRGVLGADAEGEVVEFDTPEAWTAERTEEFAKRLIESLSDEVASKLARLRAEPCDSARRSITSVPPTCELREDDLETGAGPETVAPGRAISLGSDDLPKEVSTEQAAFILGCSKDTVLRFKRAGALEWRNMASPDSSRPIFRFTLASVMKLRTAYEVDEPLPRLPKEPQRRSRRGRRAYKHLDLDD